MFICDCIQSAKIAADMFTKQATRRSNKQLPAHTITCKTTLRPCASDKHDAQGLWNCLNAPKHLLLSTDWLAALCLKCKGDFINIRLAGQCTTCTRRAQALRCNPRPSGPQLLPATQHQGRRLQPPARGPMHHSPLTPPGGPCATLPTQNSAACFPLIPCTPPALAQFQLTSSRGPCIIARLR